MRQRLVRITAVSLVMLVALVAVLGAGLFWRLAQGPVSLDFVTDAIERAINRNLSGMTIALAGAVIERDRHSGIPRFRLRNVELRDTAGHVIARAPRAAIGVEGRALLSGRIVPREVELIGPRILIRRNLGGGFELGFGAEPADEADTGESGPDSKARSKGDRIDAQTPIMPQTRGATLLEVLNGNLVGAGTAKASIASLDDIRISDANLSLFDESNDALWSAPDADLVFKRMPYGFALVVNAAVASGGGPWRLELAANYRREAHNFQLSARIHDLIPANVSDEIFALSQFAQVRLPLSGHAELELDEAGRVLKGSAEFTAAAGRVGFPDYILEPLVVDEGSVRLDYDPATGGVVIQDSSVLVGSSRAELTGRIDPDRPAGGRLSGLRIKLNARNVSLDAQGTVTDPVAIERIDFDGLALIDAARLEVNDLTVTAGDAWVRVKGGFIGGRESLGIRLGGRIRNLPAPVLKKLWPPVIAPNTRKWLAENIKSGSIAEGEFIIDLAPDALALALKERSLPNDAIDARLRLAGVATTYFKGLPALRGARGVAHLQGNRFDLGWEGGAVELPSGKSLAVPKGSMTVADLLAPISPATFHIEAEGSAGAALEYADLPDLGLLARAGLDVDRLAGAVRVGIDLAIPLQKVVPRDAVVVTATGRIKDASLKGAIADIDLTAGDLALEVSDGEIRAAGPVKIEGMAAKVSWVRGLGPGAKQSATIETELDEKEREKIGAAINDYVRGPVRVKVTIPDLGDGVRKLTAEADLSASELRFDAINWRRAPAPKTSASFDYVAAGAKGGAIENLVIAGKGVSIKGSIKLDDKGDLAEARLPTVVLNEENRFGLDLRRAEGRLAVAITGASFDARPLIKSMFSTRKTGPPAPGEGPSFIADATLGRLYAHRGEVITDVVAHIVTRGSSVQQASIRGNFSSGQPVSLRIDPAGDGTREMAMTGGDGGAALRAANLYSKIAGGRLDLKVTFARDSGAVRSGRLTLRDFEVRDEAALAELDAKGKPRKGGQRKPGIPVSKLDLPFTTDARFVRLDDVLLKGPDLGATAQGLIRKSDGAIDITGTIIPVYALNSMLSNIPLFGDIIAGGKGEGIIGLTYALGGSMAEPKFQVNPVSALAPGILRKLFEYDSPGPRPKPWTGRKDG